ncbi:hypothetical protein Tco_1192856 [Tanacetum coccineum]
MSSRMMTRCAGRSANAPRGGRTGRRVGRGVGRVRERTVKPEGQGNDRGVEENRRVDGIPDLSAIIAQQLQNLLPTILAQLGNQSDNQGINRNQNGEAANDNIQGDVRNVIGNNGHRGCSYKEFLALTQEQGSNVVELSDLHIKPRAEVLTSGITAASIIILDESMVLHLNPSSSSSFGRIYGSWTFNLLADNLPFFLQLYTCALNLSHWKFQLLKLHKVPVVLLDGQPFLYGCIWKVVTSEKFGEESFALNLLVIITDVGDSFFDPFSLFFEDKASSLSTWSTHDLTDVVYFCYYQPAVVCILKIPPCLFALIGRDVAQNLSSSRFVAAVVPSHTLVTISEATATFTSTSECLKRSS